MKPQQTEVSHMNIIEVNNLTKTYGTLTAVDHISFTVEQGSMLGFLGINGAGKSTAINMLSTLLRPDSGTAAICGHRLGHEDEQIRRKIGIVYQQNVLDDLLSVRENLICRGILHGASRSEAAAQLNRLCGILKLEDILGKRYKTLSGGQKRRCEIAAALMHTPQVLFLDEPTTGLDPATRKDVWQIIEMLRRDQNMTVFLTTHYMEEAAEADRIIILDHGRIIASGTPFELKDRYAKDKLRLFCTRELSGLPQGSTPTGFGYEIPLNRTLDALPILDALRNQVDGFEVIQGNMDDVFLNAVGTELEA
jgi:multidrug/hemolysin transport system ATP-binding protein